VSDNESRQDGLGVDFPGPGARALLRLLLPAGRREECVGDLLEEAETVVLPQRGRSAARRWFWWQALTSASPMHAQRCAREVGMHRQRWLVVAAIAVLGALMALDSGLDGAPRFIVWLVSLAILVPAGAGLLSGNLRVHAVAAIASTAILIAARLSSGVELRWYAIPWILYVLLRMNRHYEHKLLGKEGRS
jgi:hypothetical protein